MKKNPDKELEKEQDPEAKQSLVEAVEEALSKIASTLKPIPNRHQRRKEKAKKKKGGRGFTKSPKKRKR